MILKFLHVKPCVCCYLHTYIIQPLIPRLKLNQRKRTNRDMDMICIFHSVRVPLLTVFHVILWHYISIASLLKVEEHIVAVPYKIVM